MAIQDAESGETGSGDLDSGFNGRPDGWGNEIPCANRVRFGIDSKDRRALREREGRRNESKRERGNERLREKTGS